MGTLSPTTEANTRWLELDGTANTRDLGTLPCREGTIAPGLVIRSDDLEELSAADVDQLVDGEGVRTVIDLRGMREREGRPPSPLSLRSEVVNLSTPLIPEDAATEERVAQDRWATRPITSYIGYLTGVPDSLVAAVRRLTDPAAGATIVHCAAGKDRTGAFVALMLDLLEVPRGAIVEDYLLTNDRVGDLYARLLTHDVYADGARRVGVDGLRVDAETIGGTLDYVAEELGGSRAYLRRLGLGEDELDAFRRRFVVGSQDRR